MYPTLALNSLRDFEDDLELQIVLPPPPKYWCVPPYLVYSTLIRASTSCMLGKHSVVLSPMPSPVVSSLCLCLVPTPTVVSVWYACICTWGMYKAVCYVWMPEEDIGCLPVSLCISFPPFLKKTLSLTLMTHSHVR